MSKKVASVPSTSKRRPSKTTIRSSENEEEKEKCPICYESGQLYTLECNHAFHADCLKQLIKLECPMCRRKIDKIDPAIKRCIEQNVRAHQHEEEEQEFNRLMNQYMLGGSSGMPISGMAGIPSVNMSSLGFAPLAMFAMSAGDDMIENDEEEIAEQAIQMMQALVAGMHPQTRMTEVHISHRREIEPHIRNEIELAVKLIDSLRGAAQYMPQLDIELPDDVNDLQPGIVFHYVIDQFMNDYRRKFLLHPNNVGDLVRSSVSSLIHDSRFRPTSQSVHPPGDGDESPNVGEDEIIWYEDEDGNTFSADEYSVRTVNHHHTSSEDDD